MPGTFCHLKGEAGPLRQLLPEPDPGAALLADAQPRPAQHRTARFVGASPLESQTILMGELLSPGEPVPK